MINATFLFKCCYKSCIGCLNLLLVSDKQHTYVSADGDDVDGDKKNGRKQKTLFQAFGDVFK